jgi:glutathione S-transferase
VRLLLSHLGLEFQRIEFNVDDGSTRTAEFLAKNPNGKVPTIRLADGSHLFESNAILYYFAEGTNYLPAGKRERAAALQWMFFEQYSHEPHIAVARFICGWTPIDSPRRADLPRLRERGHEALAVMERHLSSHAWFTGDFYGIADIALFAYTCVADHGGIGLDRYPAIRDWLARVSEVPGFVPLPQPDAAAQSLIDRST